jgi:hypothetical protein
MGFFSLSSTDRPHVQAWVSPPMTGWVRDWVSAWLGECVTGWVHDWVSAWLGVFTSSLGQTCFFQFLWTLLLTSSSREGLPEEMGSFSLRLWVTLLMTLGIHCSVAAPVCPFCQRFTFQGALSFCTHTSHPIYLDHAFSGSDRLWLTAEK